MSELTPDLAVIGAGSGGLSVAAGAAQMGADVVLIEKHKMGGDCLNVGCVPSKSIIAAAHAAHAVRHSGRFGVNGHEPEVRFGGVHGHVRDVIAGIAPHDGVERFTGLGVNVLQGEARFTGPDTIAVNGQTVRAKRFVLATGARAAVPPITGVETVPYLTNETVFDLTERPERLLVIGGGPIGVEMTQAFRRLGAEVTLFDRFTIMPKDDADAVAVVRRSLRADGVDLRERVEIRRVARAGNGVAVVIADADGREATVRGSHLLLAAGRRPNVEELGLERAGIDFTPRGVKVDAALRTSNRKVFAVGDVTGGYQFTHMAGYHAGIVIKRALFKLPARVDERAVPWVTYVDPELAQVGLSEATADERGLKVKVLRLGFDEIDRARAERATDGFVKVVVDRRGVVLGATVVGPHAGELIQTWVLAVQERIKIGRIAQMIAPYPTLGEINKRVAGSYYTPSLFSARTKRVVQFLQRLG